MVDLSALAVEPQVRLRQNDRRFASGETPAGSPPAKRPQVRLRRNDRRFASGETTAGSPRAKRPQVRLGRNARGCEAELAAQIKEDPRQKRRPDIAALTALFAPSRGSLPGVEVQLADLSACDQLLGNAPMTPQVAA